MKEYISECGNYKIVVDYDEYSESPENNNCVYSGFNFVLPSTQHNFKPENTYDLDDFEEYDYEKEESVPLFDSLEKEFGKGNVFHLYAYIHSCIRLSLSSGICTCPWDSGQIGFLVFEPDKNNCLDKEFKSNPEKIEEIAIQYIKDYDTYVNGECLVYNIYEREPLFNKDGEEVSEDWDSITGCCGFYDEDHCIESAFEEALSIKKDIVFDCKEFTDFIKKYKKNETEPTK